MHTKEFILYLNERNLTKVQIEWKWDYEQEYSSSPWATKTEN